jgi:Zn-dependent metalloprotease/subtilisin-like proprotein convertase family protein
LKRSVAVASVAALAGALLTGTATSASAVPTPDTGATSSAGATSSTGAAGVLARADQALGRNRGAVRASADDAFVASRSSVDADGTAHVRYARTYRGLRVSGGDIVVHTRPDGGWAGASVGLAAPLSVDTTARISAAQARQSARAAFTGRIARVDTPELFVDATTGNGRLAWETVVEGWAADGQTPSRLHVVTDAATGKTLRSQDEIMHVNGTGNSIYSGPVTIDTTLSGSTYTMIDPSHGNGNTCDLNNGTSTCVNFTDADNVWGDGTNTNRQSAGVDAHLGAATTFDYFKFVHGRNGIFGNGAGVPSRVHYGNAYVNAFWDGAQMTYGDGANNAKPLVSLDVAGHEMSHGVTEALAGLVYSGESGGLNEATSDIFGNMVEFYANTPADPGDYDVGEKIDIRGTGAPLRYMYNPALDGSSHTCWSTTTKSVDVHYSSGVANHFYFMLAERSGTTAYGTSPVCGTAAPVTGIGRTKAEKIWYRALDVYFTSSTSYVNTTTPANTARAYTLQAATDLYGLCSTEYKTVQAAWTATNVAGNDSECVNNDFSLAVTPAAASVDPGSSVTATVSSTLIKGSVQNVSLAASGLPAGATASFSPATITSDGGSSTLTISTTTAIQSGVYQITVVGTGSIEANRTATLTLTVNGLPGCSGSNATDVAIPDNTTVESTIVISGCDGTAGAGSTVEVHIVHTYIGDLVVNLVAPDGSTYLLHNRTGAGTDNIDQVYTVDLTGETANGGWKLRVQDAASVDTGYINSWALNLTGGGTPPTPVCSGTNDTDVTIPDPGTVESTITTSNCARNASATSTVEVHIVHPRRANLTVSLVAPDGSVYQLFKGKGGGANLDQTFTVDLSSEPVNGAWKLRVQDSTAGNAGYLNSWTFTP